ncbi:MAG: hypothetical protein IAF94_10525, partial [Pirellulaceae bacterium]|nr:hypothetical protein [Pirellulaceae bacterium]
MRWPALFGLSARRLGAASLLGCGGLLACASNAWGQTPEPFRLPQVEAEAYAASAGDSSPSDQLDVQQVVTGLAPTEAERISALEKKLDDLAKKAAAKPAAAGDKKPDGVWEDVSAEKWTVKLGGHVQTDYINWATASPSIVGDTNYFEFRRLRLVADGTGYGVFDFRLQ